MEQWQDQGIVLSARPHGEGGAIVALLTESMGRHSGYVRGATSSKMRGVLEPGNLVGAHWQSRVEGNLGSYNIEQERNYASLLMADPLRLGALMAACALCDEALPEREAHPGLFHGFLALLEALAADGNDLWGVSYVVWEIALMRELGFSLDLTRCAGGGSAENLAYVSPKSGHAVSVEAGGPYKEKLLPLPEFLKPQRGAADEGEILTGLRLTGYFLEHWVFNHHTKGVPPARLVFQERLERAVENESGACNLVESL